MPEPSAARTAVIANPTAGRTRDEVRWHRLEVEIRRQLAGANLRTTQRPGDERAAVTEILSSGVDRLVVAGGDGTLHQVVNALLEACPAPSDRPTLAVLPLGSGNDFARGLGIPLDPFDALRALGSAHATGVDAGRITFVDERPARSIHWLNQSYLGFGAAVVRRVALARRPADQRAYTRAVLREIARARPHRYTLESGTGSSEAIEATNLLVTNGRYSGSGMLSSPLADPTDGKFEIVLVGPVGRLRLLTGLRRFRSGTHLDLPEVRTWTVSEVTVRSDDPEALVEADGDIVGRLPARYEVLPGALRFFVPTAASAVTRR